MKKTNTKNFGIILISGGLGKFFKWKITISVIILIVFAVYLSLIHKSTPISKVNVNLDYPVFSLKPHIADDWSSFFVINHIYPRLSKELGVFRSNSVVKEKLIECADEKYAFIDKDCHRVKVHLKLKTLLMSCSGLPYKKENFDYELQEIANKKKWLLPDFNICRNRSGFDTCFEFTNHYNIDHLLRSIYLRFGWSLDDEKNNKYGIQPNCFEASVVKGSQIYSGKLKLQGREVVVGQNANSDIFLYGTKINNPEYETLTFFNPVYYYFVINGIFSDVVNTNMANEIGVGLLQSQAIDKVNVHPDSKKEITRKTMQVVLPDFVPNCSAIQKRLSTIEPAFNFKCQNILEQIETVKKGEVWEAFVSPLTPGLPGQKAIELQYFSLSSKENWLGNDKPEATQAILLGQSEGRIQVKKNLFCKIRPNPLGLSDITIDDFIECD